MTVSYHFRDDAPYFVFSDLTLAKATYTLPLPNVMGTINIGKSSGGDQIR